MKPLKSLLLLAFAMVFMISCQPKTKESSLEKELMDLHDAQMAKMDKTHQLKKSLTALENDSALNDEQRAEIRSKIEQIKAADKSMMMWMRDYNRPDSTMNMEAQEKYFEAEMVKMEAVKTNMDESIKAAKNCLDKYENHQK